MWYVSAPHQHLITENDLEESQTNIENSFQKNSSDNFIEGESVFFLNY
jgi:hypothetical protein